MQTEAAVAPPDIALAPLPGDDLHALLRRLRREGPVARVRFLGLEAFAVLGHAELAAAFRDGERFPPHVPYRIGIEPVVGRNFQTMEGAEHRLVRRLATPAFRSRAIERYGREGMVRLVHELIDGFAAAGEVDLTGALTHRYPFLVISRLLGVPREQEAQFHGWAVDLLSFATAPERSHAANAELTRCLLPAIRERRLAPREDVISGLIRAEAEGRRFSDEEILSHVRLLFAAGATTTHDALGNLLYALLTTPGAWARVVAEPAARAGAIEEALRWEPPVALLPRTSGDEDIDFGGTRIPARSWVLFAISGANRDPAVFADPDRFDLERRCDAMLTFGPGLRSCPGMHLARKELQVALDVLCERLPELRLLDANAARPQGAVIRGPKALPVAF